MNSILIVGSGVAGATVARQLLAADNEYQITMFEAGPDIASGHYRTWLDHLMADTNPYESFVEDPRTENEHFGLRGSRLFVKGGTTNHWGGETPRFKPEDFELKSRTGFGADWPITYDDLSTYYTQAEFLLGIEGDSDDDDPPRYGQKFPFPAAPFTLNNMPIINALDKLGMSYGHMPLARNATKCVTTGTCDYCPVNARYTASFDVSELKKEYGRRLDLRMKAPVLKILTDGKKRSLGVRYLNLQTGVRDSMEGDAVVVCSGTVESAKLLLASANSTWPDGIGNDSGHVGRHLIGHPLVSARGIRAGNTDKMHQELGFVTLASRHFDTPKQQKQGKFFFTMGDRSTFFLEREILANKSRAKINAKMTSTMRFSIGGSIEQFESPENRVSLGSGTTRHGLHTTRIDFGVNDITRKAQQTHAQNLVKVLKAADCKEESISVTLMNPDGAHATSTCRMSRSDADGVVDENLRVHNTDNLYVCSNAVFPNVTAVNPTLTVATLAVRLAEHIDQQKLSNKLTN